MSGQGEDHDDDSAVEEARDQVAALRELIRERSVAGANALQGNDVRRAARALLHESKTNPEIAREINAVQDKGTRQALLAARDEEKALTAPITSREAYIQGARRLVRDMEDPARRARAAEIVGQLSSHLGVDRSRDQAGDRERDRDIEASR